MTIASTGQPTFEIELTADEAALTLKAVQLSKASVARSIRNTAPGRKLTELQDDYRNYANVEAELIQLLDEIHLGAA